MRQEKDYFLSGKMNEECGVFGVYNVEDAAQMIYYGLHSLQHRGQEGVGIAAFDSQNINRYRGEGLVTEIFTADKLEKLPGNTGIGHVRYSTSGGGGIENTQPLMVRSHTGDFAIAHNGNIVNAKELKLQLEFAGSIFHSTSDSEIIGHLIQRESGTFLEKMKKALLKLEGAFSFLILKGDTLYIMRDKNGLRPLSLAKLENGYAVSSESSAFDIVGAEYIRAVKPGEIIIINKNGIEADFYTDNTQYKMCAMEYIYFSRPDSVIEGINVHHSRRDAGKVLAEESPAAADIVIGVPDSSLSAAMGYAEALGLPYEMGLVKNRYVGRTFIKPNQHQREKGVKMKLSAVSSVVKDKRVILIDDSIVRGTTSKYIIKLLKDAGATEVHVRIASPAIISPCFYGVDMSTYSELISAKLNEEELAQFIGADSVAFISLKGLGKAIGTNTCTACFTGEYFTSVFSLLDNLKKEGR